MSRKGLVPISAAPQQRTQNLREGGGVCDPRRLSWKIISNDVNSPVPPPQCGCLQYVWTSWSYPATDLGEYLSEYEQSRFQLVEVNACQASTFADKMCTSVHLQQALDQDIFFKNCKKSVLVLITWCFHALSLTQKSISLGLNLHLHHKVIFVPKQPSIARATKQKT